MTTTNVTHRQNVNRLAEKCRFLEDQCAEYIRSLEAANRNLVAEAEQRKVAESALKRAHADLERTVAERTREIRRLKDRLHAENVVLKQELAASQSYGAIIGNSPPIRAVITKIERVAATDASVLIHGESGTGKELVAREIHRRSLRHDAPLIKVNCATIPKDLYESEFFGHVRGAFTGAVKDRIGRFEAADGGTLFLDEVGEIPLDMQSKLLRVLQEGEYERLGEEKTRTVDVRVIAATNKDLSAEVAARRFRDDLFYRLNVFPIEVAPLRQRTADIPLLVTHFVDNLSRELNRPCPEVTQANIMDLQSYPWPGNVRELANAIERAMILSRSRHLDFKSLSAGSDASSSTGSPPLLPADGMATVLSEDELRQFERRNTIHALRQCNWKIYGDDGAAHLLEIKPTTLIERMKRMQITKPRQRPARTP